MLTNKYKVSVALFTTSVWQLNFILCYLSDLKEKKSDGKLVRNELKYLQ